MKFKFCLKLLLIFSLAIPYSGIASTKLISSFSKEQAFFMLFGNYDSDHQIAVWENIVFPSKKDQTFFWGKKIGIVSSLLFARFEDHGDEKFFLLTKTIPVGIPFRCHACLPLISAAVFTKINQHWKIESQNRFLLYAGEYGESPLVKLVTVENQQGIQMKYKHYGEGIINNSMFVLPFNNIHLLSEAVSDDHNI